MSVLTKSAPIDGKENVFDYQISVGKETGNLWRLENQGLLSVLKSLETGKPGFIIDTKVIVRRHLDNTYNLQASIDIKYVNLFNCF